MLLPAKPVPGQSIPASWGSTLVDYLRSITPRSSASVRVCTGAGGTTFEARGAESQRPSGFHVRGTEGLAKVPMLRAYLKNPEHPETIHEDDELVAPGVAYNANTMYLYLTWEWSRNR